jgi:hypothetical protein
MLKVSTLAAMTEPERDRALGQLVDRARGKPNGGLTTLEARIRGFEAQYKLSSAEMRVRVATHELTETSDIAKWLLLLSVRDRGR